MSQLLPYLGVALLLLVVSVLWARQIFLTPKSRMEVVARREEAPHYEGLGERIFRLQDWDFVSRNVPSEIQKMFLHERTVLGISWLRRIRRRVSFVMRAHLAAVQQIGDLQLVTEMRLALSYLLFVILCDSLIGWIWLRGPVRTRKMVRRTLRTMAWLRGTFEQLMVRVDSANGMGPRQISTTE